MLDKEVIQYTKEGIVKKNLATGESNFVTRSDYGREMKYKAPKQESQYHSAHERSREKRVESSTPSPRKSGIKRGPQTQSASESSGEKTVSSEMMYHPPGHAESSPRHPDRKQNGEMPHDQTGEPPYSGIPKRRGSNRYIRSTNSTSESSQAPRTYGKPRSGAIEKHLIQNENLGIETTGRSIRSIRRFYTGIRILRNIKQRKRNFPSIRNLKIGKRMVQSAENGLINNKDENLGLETTGRSIQAVRRFYAGIQKLRSARKAGSTAAKAGGGVRKLVSILKNPAVLKVVLIAAAVILGIILLCALFGMVTESVVGSTTEHPELTAYVQKLDDNFMEKIEALKKQYEKSSHSTVEIQGSDVVNTDPNVLAILATGDWTDIELTDANKAKLDKCYDVLNTYKVKKTDKKVNETSGTGSKSTYTEHHIIITIQTFSARDKIDAFKFTDAQKKNVLDMLDLLEQIEGAGGVDSVPNIPNPGTGSAPGQAFDDPQVQALVTEANRYLGFPYVWGGSNPSTSFDCSGFVCWVFTHSGVRNTPRTTAQGLYNQCTPVSASEAKPGDLVFFTKTYPTSDTVTHIGIYVGNNRMIHCGDPIQYTTLEKPYWQAHFYSFGRLSGK